MATSAYRPAQWQSPTPQKVLITFPGQGTPRQYSTMAGNPVVLPTNQTLYAFDAEIQNEHEQVLRKTAHPVQTGASIADHAYLEPARLVMDVGMSDAMAAYFNPSTWSGSPSKSVSAHLTMLALQFSRIPLQVTTRLRTYTNMVIESLIANETSKTAHGLRLRIEFGQIFQASVVSPTTSSRPQDTNETELGSLSAQPPTEAQQSQNNVEGLEGVPAVPSSAVGAGTWSSVNTDNLTKLPPPK